VAYGFDDAVQHGLVNTNETTNQGRTECWRAAIGSGTIAPDGP